MPGKEVKANFFVVGKGDTKNELFSPEQQMEVKVKPVDLAKEIAEWDMVPFGERMFIIEDELDMVGPIYVPQTARQGNEGQLNSGYVIAAGEDVQFVKVGDHVFYGQYSGAYIRGRKYRMMNERDIIAKFKEKQENAESIS